jgi:hypothetical protein
MPVITGVIGKLLVVVDFFLDFLTDAGTGGGNLFNGACGGNLVAVDYDISTCGQSIVGQLVALTEVGIAMLNYFIMGLMVV